MNTEVPELEPLFRAILNVLGPYKGICKKYGLSWYVIGGTAIGAIRHKGFIPWDDDFDVAMPRADYEKFLRIAENELPQHLKIVNRHNTPEFDELFAKVQDVREGVIHEVESKVGFKLSNGIYIDVFPVDVVPLLGGYKKIIWRINQYKWAFVRRYLSGLISSYSWRGWGPWLMGAFFSTWYRIRNVHELLDYLERCFMNCSGQGLMECYLFDYFALKRTPVFPNDWCSPTKELSFEDTAVNVPAEIEKYLTMRYGDYMKLPPSEERYHSHSLETYRAWWRGPTTNNSCYRV